MAEGLVVVPAAPALLLVSGLVPVVGAAFWLVVSDFSVVLPGAIAGTGGGSGGGVCFTAVPSVVPVVPAALLMLVSFRADSEVALEAGVCERDPDVLVFISERLPVSLPVPGVPTSGVFRLQPARAAAHAAKTIHFFMRLLVVEVPFLSWPQCLRSVGFQSGADLTDG